MVNLFNDGFFGGVVYLDPGSFPGFKNSGEPAGTDPGVDTDLVVPYNFNVLLGVGFDHSSWLWGKIRNYPATSDLVIREVV